MKNYELTLVISPELNDEAIRGVLQGLSVHIQEKGGLLEKQETKGKSRQGILAIIGFSFKQEEIENLVKKVKEEENIIRSMVMAVLRKRTQTPSLTNQTTQGTKKPPEKEEPKMTIEEIDKKLEEIFKDLPARETQI